MLNRAWNRAKAREQESRIGKSFDSLQRMSNNCEQLDKLTSIICIESMPIVYALDVELYVCFLASDANDDQNTGRTLSRQHFAFKHLNWLSLAWLGFLSINLKDNHNIDHRSIDHSINNLSLYKIRLCQWIMHAKCLHS